VVCRIVSRGYLPGNEARDEKVNDNDGNKEGEQ
jgi:hypothetical protein